MKIEDLYQQIEPYDTLSISPAPLPLGGRIAVAITGPTRTLWVVPYRFTPPGVFQELHGAGDMALRYLGDLDIPVPVTVDELYDVLVTCPRCKGAGEVEVLDVLESGHTYADMAPCPLCQFHAEDLPF